MNLNKYESSEIKKLRKVLEEKPDDFYVSVELAERYINVGWYNEAYDLYSVILTKHPNDFALSIAFANLCASMKKYPEAESILFSVLNFCPDRIEPLNNLGIVLMNMNRIDEALTCFEKVLKLESDNFGAMLNIGNCLNVKGNTREALKYLEKVISLRPDFSDAWYDIGNIYLTLGDNKKAIDFFNKALKYEPMFYSALKNCGVAYEALGDYKTALEFYLKALLLNTTDATLYSNIGNIYFKQNLFAKAMVYFTKTITIDSKITTGWIGIRTISLLYGKMDLFVNSTIALLGRLSTKEISKTVSILRSIGLKRKAMKILRASDKLKISSQKFKAESILIYAGIKKYEKYIEELVSEFSSKKKHLEYLVEFYFTNGEYSKIIELYSTKKIAGSTRYFYWLSLLNFNMLEELNHDISNYEKLSGEDENYSSLIISILKYRLNDIKSAKSNFKNAIDNNFKEFEFIDTHKELKAVYLNILDNGY